MTRDEENRKLALWIGYTVRQVPVKHTTEPRYSLFDPDGDRDENRHIYATVDEALDDLPNFRTDEAASAMLLDELIHAQPDWNAVSDLFNSIVDALRSGVKRRDAIVLAALALLEGKHEL